ncbi:hypothetical protein V5J37_003418 [Endozoicomonas sp. NE43]
MLRNIWLSTTCTIEEDYYDPTKILGHRECGLHTSVGRQNKD